MTPEEKKKYSETVEEAKRLYETANSDQRYVLETLFPELLESEDEKIRKEIIAVFKGQFAFTSEEDNKRYIAWLEKQKEFVSADFDDVWETADCDELTAPLEKYSKDAIKKMCHAWYDKGIELERKAGLKKQEWNEDDEDDVTILEAYIRSNEWSDSHINRALCIIERLVNKLKSISINKPIEPKFKA